MSTKNDPAFPIQAEASNGQVIECAQFGLSKLEWFAGMALQGLCANEKLTTEGMDKLAAWAFDQAEAMIAEGERRK